MENPGKWKKFFSGLIVVFLLSFIVLIFLPLNPSSHGSIKALSISNLKQLATSQLIYHVDYDDVYPPQLTYLPETGGGKGLMAALMPYAKNESIFIDPYVAKEDPFIPTEYETKEFSYVNAISIQRWLKKGLINSTQIENPAEQVYMRTAIRKQKANGGLSSTSGSGFICGYVDGHVRFVDAMPISKL